MRRSAIRAAAASHSRPAPTLQAFPRPRAWASYNVQIPSVPRFWSWRWLRPRPRPAGHVQCQRQRNNRLPGFTRSSPITAKAETAPARAYRRGFVATLPDRRLFHHPYNDSPAVRCGDHRLVDEHHLARRLGVFNQPAARVRLFRRSNGSCTSGFISSQFCKAPGGVSGGNVFAGSNQDARPDVRLWICARRSSAIRR